MTQIDYNNYIKNKLQKEGYSNKASAMVALELSNVDSRLIPLVEKWLDDNEEDYESQGYSIFGLMKSRRMTYPAALLTIDWLIKEPEAAKKSINKGIK